MTVTGRTNSDGTPRKRKDYLNSDEIRYIREHLKAGIPKERIANRCYCDLEDVDQVEKRYKKEKIS